MWLAVHCAPQGRYNWSASGSSKLDCSIAAEAAGRALLLRSMQGIGRYPWIRCLDHLLAIFCFSTILLERSKQKATLEARILPECHRQCRQQGGSASWRCLCPLPGPLTTHECLCAGIAGRCSGLRPHRCAGQPWALPSWAGSLRRSLLACEGLKQPLQRLGGAGGSSAARCS